MPDSVAPATGAYDSHTASRSFADAQDDKSDIVVSPPAPAASPA
jgi:hypothetical protein